jgi:hypothetical protein
MDVGDGGMPKRSRNDAEKPAIRQIVAFLYNLFYHENDFPPSGFAQWVLSSSDKLPNGALRQSLLTMRIAACA